MAKLAHISTGYQDWDAFNKVTSIGIEATILFIIF